MLSYALMLNAKSIFTDPVAANDNSSEYLKSEAANDAENGSETSEEQQITEADHVFDTMAVSSLGSLSITGGVNGTDFSYDSNNDIITIKTNSMLMK